MPTARRCRCPCRPASGTWRSGNRSRGLGSGLPSSRKDLPITSSPPPSGRPPNRRPYRKSWRPLRSVDEDVDAGRRQSDLGCRVLSFPPLIARSPFASITTKRVNQAFTRERVAEEVLPDAMDHRSPLAGLRHEHDGLEPELVCGNRRRNADERPAPVQPEAAKVALGRAPEPARGWRWRSVGHTA